MYIYIYSLWPKQKSKGTFSSPVCDDVFCRKPYSPSPK